MALRRPALVAVISCSVIMAALGARYAGESQPRWSDEWTLSIVRTAVPVRASIANSVIALANPLPLAVLTTALALTCLLVGRRSLALLAGVGPMMTVLATMALKPLVDRTKDGDLAYPSGHAGAATALALVAGLLLVSLVPLRPWAATVTVAVPTVAVGAGVGLAMVVANYHYATDVVGGFCTAVSVVLGLALALDRARGRRSDPPERSASDRSASGL